MENEFDLFCRSLAIQLKNMPLNRALVCQEKFQSIMTQERLSQVMMNNYSPSNETQYSMPNSPSYSSNYGISSLTTDICTDNEYSISTPQSSNDLADADLTGIDILSQAINSIADMN